MKTPSRPALRAWRRHVHTLPCPLRWADIAEDFVEALNPKQPDAILALTLLCLDLAHDWNAFRQGDFIDLVTTHRYVYFDGHGFGDGRTLEVVAKLVHHMRADRQIDDAEATRLLIQVDDARESVGLAPKHGPKVRDYVFQASELPEIAARFGSTVDDPFLAELVPSAVSVVSSYVRFGDSHVRFGQLRPSALAADILTAPTSRSREAVLGSSRTLLSILSDFYRWLAHDGYLDRTVATRLANELGLAALRMAA
jgi:hypothetical protein